MLWCLSLRSGKQLVLRLNCASLYTDFATESNKMNALEYLLVLISCCLVTSTRSALALPSTSHSSGANAVRPEGKHSKLDLGSLPQNKNFSTNFCDLNCAGKDLDLETCETQCDADFPHNLDKQKQCQELCASTYLQCLEKCTPYKVVKK